jgi:phosphoribosylformylglycinamidine cyclo-ligase
MLRTFNCGVGMIVLAAPESVGAVSAILEREGETVACLGEVIAAKENAPRVAYHGNLPR